MTLALLGIIAWFSVLLLFILPWIWWIDESTR